MLLKKVTCGAAVLTMAAASARSSPAQTSGAQPWETAPTPARSSQGIMWQPEADAQTVAAQVQTASDEAARGWMARARDPAVDARFKVRIMEGVLERAVEQAAKAMNQQLRTVSPDLVLLTGAAQARGYRLDGYGMFFDVRVPAALRQSMGWTVRMMRENSANVDQALATFKRLAGGLQGKAREDAEIAVRQIELQVRPAQAELDPYAPGFARASASAPGAGSAGASSPGGNPPGVNPPGVNTPGVNAGNTQSNGDHAATSAVISASSVDNGQALSPPVSPAAPSVPQVAAPAPPAGPANTPSNATPAPETARSSNVPAAAPPMDGASVLAAPSSSAVPTGAEPARPAPPRINPLLIQNPDLAYEIEVREALISAMLEWGVTLPLQPTEWLTVAARDNQDVVIPGEAADVVTIIMRVKGSDLADFRAGRVTGPEIRSRVEVREF